MYKREKWHFLTTNVGYDKYTVPIFEASARNKCVPLLKTLMSSFCQNNCKFCAFRAERKTVRERWLPEELARVTMKVWKAGRIKGLFLSSSVEKDPSATVEKEIEAVEFLRRQGFTAYVHLRMMPGVDVDLIKQSVEIADRVGINIEFPRAEYYDDMKIFLDFRQDLIKRMRILAHEVDRAQKQGKCKAGLDTQMIVGASNETDKQILQISDWLYRKLKARRVYFSAFEPIKNTPLENKPAENRWREYRLYQCSFLLQKYNYHAKDFVLDDFDNLPVNQDPKFLIAKKSELRVDVNNASYEELIKVPGIGLQTAKNILSNRPIKNLQQLRQLGVLNRALQFLDFKRDIQTNLNFWK
jgi:predicted DNA-binding helix-hairpin-helix protein